MDAGILGRKLGTNPVRIDLLFGSLDIGFRQVFGHDAAAVLDPAISGLARG